jgi:hypothetical protein
MGRQRLFREEQKKKQETRKRKCGASIFSESFRHGLLSPEVNLHALTVAKPEDTLTGERKQRDSIQMERQGAVDVGAFIEGSRFVVAIDGNETVLSVSDDHETAAQNVPFIENGQLVAGLRPLDIAVKIHAR